ncbi:MAG TPA: carbamoyltransferase N-terminal domain-containing protein, partial [Blastocatellia bacterium]|nr:carbamoyltransferase N-terminal domain-containing protein [Blastocatellia bacterium]
MTNILGISGQERDAAAALVSDGKLVAAIEEEKLSRIRHVGMNYQGGLPYQAIRFCLDQGKIGFEDIDYIAYYLEPERLFHRTVAFYSSRAIHVPDPGSMEAFPNYFVEALDGLRQRLKTRSLAESLTGGRGRLVEVNHHLAHGASAFFASGFDRAAVISAGYLGDMTSTALMTGEGERLTLQSEADFPHSIGLVYNAVTAALGFNFFDDWHKTMWMSAAGRARYEDLFRDMLAVDSRGLPVVNLEYFDQSFRGNPRLSEKFFERAGLRPRKKGDPFNAKHRDLAASLQSRIEDVLCEMAAGHRERTGAEDLCLAGGVALNSMANSAIERRAGFKRLFVQPAAGNAGCCIGAALYVWHSVLENRERVYRMEHAFLGPRFDEETIKRVLDNCKISYEYFLTEDKLISEVARSLAQSKIAGWFR